MFKTIANKLIAILITVVLLTTTACVKSKPGIPGTTDPKAISAGVVTSFQGIVTTLQALVDSGQDKFLSELNAAKKILASATVINNTLQAGNQNPADLITALAQDAEAISAVFGANSDILTALNLGISIFRSVAVAFGWGNTTAVNTEPQAASAPQDTLQARAKKLNDVWIKYQKRSKP